MFKGKEQSGTIKFNKSNGNAVEVIQYHQRQERSINTIQAA